MNLAEIRISPGKIKVHFGILPRKIPTLEICDFFLVPVLNFAAGLPESCVTRLVFEIVIITAPPGLTVRNAKAVAVKKSRITVEQGGPLILESDAEVSGLK